MNVLVIEDDNRIANLVERALAEDGHRVSVSDNGREGWTCFFQESSTRRCWIFFFRRWMDLEFWSRCAPSSARLPILVLTAVDAVPKILRAFDLGADDYLVKPFILEILLARVSAIARRVAPIELPPLLQEESRLIEAAALPFVMVRRFRSLGSSSNCLKLSFGMRV